MSKYYNFLMAAGIFILSFWPAPLFGTLPYHDDNRSPARAADNFEYTSSPLQNGWVKKGDTTGTATCSTMVGIPDDATDRHFACFSSPGGLAGIFQYPPDTSEIKSRRRHFAFSAKSVSNFTIEARVLVRWAVDSTKYYWLRYTPASGTNSQQDDTLIIYLGSGYLDGQWHSFTRDFIADIRSFLPSRTLDYLSRIYVRGNVSVTSFMTFNRHSWIEGYANQSSVAQGGTINFYLSRGDVDTIGSSSTANIEIRRYGATTDSITTISGVTVYRDTIANVDSGLSQNWPVTASWTVPQSAKSGVYMARFVITTAGSGLGKYTYCPFVVKEDSGGSKSKILFKVSNNTWQAYNFWGGHSLNYEGGSGKVSYNRPYLEVNYWCGH